MDTIPGTAAGAKGQSETKEEAIPAHIAKYLDLVPKLALRSGVAVPEVVDRLQTIHNKLAKLEFFPYLDDWSWLWMIATQLIAENVELKLKCDELIKMHMLSQLEANGFKPNMKFMG